MPYIKTNWAEDTPITTALLNKIENGIEIATKEAETLPTPLEIGARPDIKPEWGHWFQGTPEVRSDGVMEIGRYLDFHFNSDYIGDYQTRLEGKENGRLLINGHQAAMFEDPSPKHHLIRYGKDLPGLDGFITFSW